MADADLLLEYAASFLRAPLDHRPDQTGLDDGPYLPGRAPRKKPAPKSAEELTAIRKRAWVTRRASRLIHPRGDTL